RLGSSHTQKRQLMKRTLTRIVVVAVCVIVVLPAAILAASPSLRSELSSLPGCRDLPVSGVRPIAAARKQRFLGKVKEFTARCRGGTAALVQRETPWVDWSNYWAAGDASSRSSSPLFGHLSRNNRGLDGALIDLEYQRIEMIKFNLFDNATY